MVSKLSVEISGKLSISNMGNTFAKGKKLSDEHKEKISKSLIGRPKSETHKKSLQKPKSNTKNMNKHSKKQVIFLETKLVYTSIKEASESTGVSKEGISRVCSGKLKTSGGYTWKLL